METSSENTNQIHEETVDTTCNVTYAEVLSKGRATYNDASNNNPVEGNEELNGDENSSATITDTGVSSQNSAILLNNNSVNSHSLDADSLSDSFEDAEDTQLRFNSSTLVKSINNDSKQDDVGDSKLPAETVNNSAGKSNTGDSKENGSHSSGEYNESGEESDVEDVEDDVENIYPSALKWKFRPTNPALRLPETVTVLETSFGSKVFVVGTAHFSTESQEDVAKTIRAVQPDIVMIELCKSRVNILSLDEATILEESKNLNFQKIKSTMEQNGFLQGALYLLLLSMSAHLTKQLGMAPGGEFRRAYTEAMQIPGCLVHLGDRPIHITLKRALSTLSWWQKLRIAWYMLRAKEPISKEEVERCKQKDLLEEMLAEMTGEFPELSEVFVKERDTYLTYSLQMAAVPLPSPHSPNVAAPSYVVGVVGIGHVPGIKANWGKVTEKDIAPILRIPEPTMSGKVIRHTMRLSLIGLGLYAVYKFIPSSLPKKALTLIMQPFTRQQ